MTKNHFDGRILIIGFGGVARCTLPLLLKHLDSPPSRFIVMDFAEETAEKLRPYIDLGVKFVRDRIVPEKYAQQLAENVGPGDIIVDLAWNIDCGQILDWCRSNNVRYINTSVEVWDPYENRESKTPPERTLYVRHMKLREQIDRWGDNQGPTALLDHGANPGLVSHFTKRGLLDIAHRLLADRPDHPRRRRIEESTAAGRFNSLAHALDVKVIHVSERDTQVTRQARRPDEFFNTWSVEGFYEEGIAPAEMGWGTHERTFPYDGWEHKVGPGNQICLTRFGIDTFVRTRVPSSDIVGMVIRHGEAFSLSEYLSVADGTQTVVYRPTVHYAYLPCPEAVQCLAEVRANNYQNHPSWRIMGDDITQGCDELGVLLMGHEYKSWWCGTILGIDRARELIPHQNATTLQVAASVMSGVIWMIRNPRMGVRVPDDLPHDAILEEAAAYLGRIVSIPLDWTPLGEKLGSHPGAHLDDSVWQFDQFAIRAGERAPDGTVIDGPRLLKEHRNPLKL